MNRKVSDSKPEELLPTQIVAARALLRWTQSDLAEAAGVSLPTVKRIELETIAVSAAARAKVREALEDAGVEFTKSKARIGVTAPRPMLDETSE